MCVHTSLYSLAGNFFIRMDINCLQEASMKGCTLELVIQHCTFGCFVLLAALANVSTFIKTSIHVHVYSA